MGWWLLGWPGSSQERGLLRFPRLPLSLCSFVYVQTSFFYHVTQQELDLLTKEFKFCICNTLNIWRGLAAFCVRTCWDVGWSELEHLHSVRTHGVVPHPPCREAGKGK